MEIEYHVRFLKSFRKRVRPNSKLMVQFRKRVGVFVHDRSSTILRDHALKGSKSKLRAFSLSGDYRIVYYQKSDRKVVFIDVGTHNQVY